MRNAAMGPVHHGRPADGPEQATRDRGDARQPDYGEPMTNSENSLSVDVLVIGWGKGGKTLAAALAGLGQKVAMIEQFDSMHGGTCINIGCVPT